MDATRTARELSTADYLRGKYGKATLTPNEFAHETGRSGAGVRRMCVRGEIKAARIGGRWTIPVTVCARMMEGSEDID